MDQSIAQKLRELNAEFYQTFAVQFSDTRLRIQPGVRRILDSFDPDDRILDLGCGNGALARNLAQFGFRGKYTGVDFSGQLLAEAQSRIADNPYFEFVQADLFNPGWPSFVGDQASKFDLVLAFAVLHHIPGREAQIRMIQAVRSLLKPAGQFIHSNWQFLNSERLRKRIHPWDEIGLANSQVDPGDYLLDWRRGGFGLRYVHHFSEEELSTLAEATGFGVVETFYADGETGDLGLYQIWEIDDPEKRAGR